MEKIIYYKMTIKISLWPVRFLLPVCRRAGVSYVSISSQFILLNGSITHLNSCWEKCDKKCAYMFNVYKNQQSRQTGSRNPMGSNTLIWSQASYRYPISWEVFFDPSDSYFLFAKEQGYYRWALAHSSSCFWLFYLKKGLKFWNVASKSIDILLKALNTTHSTTKNNWMKKKKIVCTFKIRNISKF
jgi:hypothetical protein